MEQWKQNAPHELDGEAFAPRACFLRVEEPDFGCEGIPEGEEACGTLRVRTAEKVHTLHMAQTALFHTRFDDGMWLGTRGAQWVLVRKNGRWFPVNAVETQWLAECGLL